MSGHRNFKEPMAELSPERRARVKAEADDLNREYASSQIRQLKGSEEMRRMSKMYEPLVAVVVLGMLFAGCGPSGDELFRQAQEAMKHKDKELAAQLVLKAADKGCLEAMLSAGVIYIHGEGIEPNKELGFSMIRKAAEAGYPDAMYALGMCYGDGTGTTKDVDKARYWKKLAFDKDSPIAMFDMASEVCSETKLKSIRSSSEKTVSFPSKDKSLMAQAVKAFKRLVEEERFTNRVDVAQVYCKLGEIYAEGLAINQDTQAAISYYEKAIGLGNKWAMRELGTIYCEGKICERDYDKGVPLLQKYLGREENYWILQQLGLAYVDQDWSSADFGKAKDYFERAVYQHDNSDERGESDLVIRNSLYWLGRILMFEDELYRDDAKGIKYLKRAAEAHSSEAKYFLAAAYCDGIGVKKDLEKAYDLSGSAKYADDKTIAAEAKKLHDQLGKQLHPYLYR